MRGPSRQLLRSARCCLLGLTHCAQREGNRNQELRPPKAATEPCSSEMLRNTAPSSAQTLGQHWASEEPHLASQEDLSGRGALPRGPSVLRACRGCCPRAGPGAVGAQCHCPPRRTEGPIAKVNQQQVNQKVYFEYLILEITPTGALERQARAQGPEGAGSRRCGQGPAPAPGHPCSGPPRCPTPGQRSPRGPRSSHGEPPGSNAALSLPVCSHVDPITLAPSSGRVPHSGLASEWPLAAPQAWGWRPRGSCPGPG